jgi:hypothetical protein
VVLGVAITVSSEGGPGLAAFQEETQTLVVNAHGSMIALAAKVGKGQTLRMKNRVTKEEQTCNVVYLGPAAGGKTQVAVEFTAKAPDFWRIAFPPEDWVTTDPVSVARKSK